MGGESPNFMMILKQNATGNYFYHSYSTTGNPAALSIQITNHKQEIFAGNSFISDNSVFLQLRRSAYLFFSEGSKLYYFDKTTGNVKLYHDFGSGKIVKIDADAPETEIGIALDDGNMYVCSTDIKFLAEPNPGLDGGILHHTTGLGKIVDLIWKYGGYYGLIFNRYE